MNAIVARILSVFEKRENEKYADERFFEDAIQLRRWDDLAKQDAYPELRIENFPVHVESTLVSSDRAPTW